MWRFMRYLVFVLLFVATAHAQSLGTTTFPNSGAAATQEPFLRGILLLHSFEYDDAADAFREAQAIDPAFAMAYWGEAMTHNHPIWMQQDRAAARAVLDRIPSTAALTDRERAYLATAEVLFGEGDKDDRDDLFEVAMGELAAAYPDDNDAATLHALAILGTAHEGRDYEVYGRAAQIAQRVFEAQPDHPGAAHYLIHAYDDPDHAALALDAANAYSEIAPSASHALHMPTHIFYALGMWDEAVALNIRSYEAARDASARRGEPLNGHGWHALYWLAYAQLQIDRRADALVTLQLARDIYTRDSTGVALSHLARIRAHIEVDAAMASATIPTSARFDLPRERMDASTRAVDIFGGYIADWTSGDVAEDQQNEAFAQLQGLASAADANESTRVLALLLDAFRASNSAGASSQEQELLVEAVDLVESTPVTFGPPSFVLFPHEQLALVAGVAGDVDAANCLIDAMSARAPNRVITRRTREMLDQIRTPPTPVGLAVPQVCAR